MEQVNGASAGSNSNDHTQHGTVHYNAAGSSPSSTYSPSQSGGTTTNTTALWGSTYRVYAFEWTSTTISFSVDNHTYASVPITSLPFNTFLDPSNPMYLLVNLALGGQFPNMAPDAATLPAQLYVDWIRLYQKADGVQFFTAPGVSAPVVSSSAAPRVSSSAASTSAKAVSSSAPSSSARSSSVVSSSVVSSSVPSSSRPSGSAASSSAVSSSAVSSSGVSSSAASSSTPSSSTVSSSAISSSARSSSAPSSSPLSSSTVSSSAVSSSAASTAIAPPVSVPSPVLLNGSLCILSYALPGTIDHPFSQSISLTFTYDPRPVNASQGTAVTLLSGAGFYSFTNRFGEATSHPLTLSTTGSTLLYLANLFPVDAQGLTLSLSSPVQLPGPSPLSLFTDLQLYSSGGVVYPGSSGVLDSGSQAWMATVAGFTNRSIGAANLNSLAVDYSTCLAPITFSNGLRAPTEPNAKNGGAQLTYSYYISDTLTYSVQGNLTLTTSSPFANVQDVLGNPYQTVVNITGTRVYTFFPTSQVVTSTVTLAAATAVTSAVVTQRFYPYGLLSAAPGLYTVNGAPFLDGGGIGLAVEPAVPLNGVQLGTGDLHAAIALRLVGFGGSGIVLTDNDYVAPPLVRSQQQGYRF